MYYTEQKPKKKWGRPGNEAISALNLPILSILSKQVSKALKLMLHMKMLVALTALHLTLKSELRSFMAFCTLFSRGFSDEPEGGFARLNLCGKYKLDSYAQTEPPRGLGQLQKWGP